MGIIVGVFDKEVFIYDDDSSINGTMLFSVARIVDADTLENLRDVDYWVENRRDDWVEAVRADMTDASLEDYMQNILDDEMDEDDEEDFPCKDCVRELTDTEEREIIDKFIEDNYDIEVGTWEYSGFYSPKNSFHKTEFKGFDMIINKELAERYYKEIGLIK